MAKRKRHTTEARAAKVAQGYGRPLDDNEAYERAVETVPFRRVDSGNLARIASALERIAGYMKRQTEAMERRPVNHE